MEIYIDSNTCKLLKFKTPFPIKSVILKFTVAVQVPIRQVINKVLKKYTRNYRNIRWIKGKSVKNILVQTK